MKWNVQTINDRFRSVQSRMKYKLPNKLYAKLLTALLQMINNMPNSTHSTLNPSIIFKGKKLISMSKFFYVALHAKRVDNKYRYRYRRWHLIDPTVVIRNMYVQSLKPVLVTLDFKISTLSSRHIPDFINDQLGS